MKRKLICFLTIVSIICTVSVIPAYTSAVVYEIESNNDYDTATGFSIGETIGGYIKDDSDKDCYKL